MSDTSTTLLWSAISSVRFLLVDTCRPWISRCIGLDSRGITCRRDSEAQVSKISQKVKSRDQESNECVPLIRGVHAYLQIISYVWPRHGLGPCLGRRWTWALAQVPQFDYCGPYESYEKCSEFVKCLFSFPKLSAQTGYSLSVQTGYSFSGLGRCCSSIGLGRILYLLSVYMVIVYYLHPWWLYRRDLWLLFGQAGQV